jgi:hypothetical protein
MTLVPRARARRTLSRSTLPCRAAAAALLVALLVALSAAAAVPARAQGVPPVRRDEAAPVGVFLDCGVGCDEDFVRTEVTYVDWVRDRTAADVHVLVTSQATGGGGREFTLAFLGQRRFAGVGDTLRVVAPQGATADETRRALTRRIAQGLVRFVARTPLAERLVVTAAPEPPRPGAPTPPGQARRDRWNLWVFSVGVNANVNGERQSSFNSVSGTAAARRTTEQWKLSIQASQEYNESRFAIEDTTSTFIRRSTTVSQLAVRSLGPRLAAGLRASVGASTFENMRFFARVTPAIEYDLFPYSESTRRMLTLQYALGTESFRYIEETIFLRTAETRPVHTLTISLVQNQPWGSANLGLEGGQYLDQTNKNYASLSGGTSVRLFRGLSFNISGSLSSIHNQLYLPRRGATEQEILTQQRRLATSYSYFAFTGISYTFGSVLNNVVNPRFGRVEGGFSSCSCF